ncbi:MAG: hypothetical protein HKN03_02350 [Acidimicrobiales bacterium]|nr:hypothetical protein [Acidimicrobiales bacterium]
MVDFAVHGLPLKGIGVKVAAASVDPVASVAALKAGLHVGYPMYAEVDPHAVSAATGAFVHDGDTTYLHATAFLVDPEGRVVNAVYSTGPIGRFTASEVIRKVIFEQQKR